MTVNRPRAHVWVDIPADCRFESMILTENEARMVIGHPVMDGHTIEMDRETLRRLHTMTGETLEAMDAGSWTSSTTWISDPPNEPSASALSAH